MVRIGPDNIVGADRSAEPPHGFAHIVIDRAHGGGPRLTIDGVTLHAFTQGITVSAPTRQDPPKVTVTFLASQVELRDDTIRSVEMDPATPVTFGQLAPEAKD